MRDTGSPRADAESDFLRARRQQMMSALAARLRSDEDDVPMSYDEVVGALGRRGERSLGTLVIPLDRIVGSVDKSREFDRSFRPTSGRSRQRWERLAQAMRRGETIPPIDVYKLGSMYFVEDGHHRVSVARALGLDLIEARVKEIDTTMSTEGIGGRRDLDAKNWRLQFLRRVPLPSGARESVLCTDPWNYAILAEMVEAWAMRQMHAEGEYFDKPTMARRWHEEEFVPVLDLIDGAELRGSGEGRGDAYVRIAGERYRLIREHAWTDEVMEQLAQTRRPRKR